LLRSPEQIQFVKKPILEQYFPEKYNVRTELEITVEPGSSKITKDFDLTQ